MTYDRAARVIFSRAVDCMAKRMLPSFRLAMQFYPPGNA